MLYSEKQKLLEEIEIIYIKKDKNINIRLIIIIFVIMLFIISIIFPKIYLINHTYKKSIEIENLKKKYFSLKNENQVLKREIQILFFKNKIKH